MSKRLPLFLAAAVIGITLAAWDRSRATETTLRATVTVVEERQTSEGPDQWFMRVTTPDSVQTLGPLQARPTAEVGDTICVIQSTASHRETTYRRAPASTIC